MALFEDGLAFGAEEDDDKRAEGEERSGDDDEGGKEVSGNAPVGEGDLGRYFVYLWLTV